MIFASATVFIAGMFTFIALRKIRKQDAQLKLIMKTLYFNNKGIGKIGEKADLFLLEQQKSAARQQKSFDHHRVLVSSLNRQIKSLEVALFGWR